MNRVGMPVREKVLIWLLVAAPFLAAAGYWVTNGFSATMIRNTRVGAPCPPLKTGDILSQSLTVPDGRLDRVMLLFGTYRRINRGRVRVSLAGDNSPSDIRTVDLDISRLVDNEWAVIEFGDFRADPGSAVTLQIEAVDGSAGNEITLYHDGTGHYAGGSLARNGALLPFDLVFRIQREEYLPGIVSAIVADRAPRHGILLVSILGLLVCAVSVLLGIGLIAIRMRGNGVTK
ncbi:hypothetical protein JXA40_06725 [bacterium]|nr:hypothetical protein [candidate division CSSED10-310 bacterium]